MIENSGQISQKLDRAESSLIKIHALFQAVAQSGVSVDYPKVSLTILENFIPYAREDLQKGELERANEAADELLSLSDETLQRLEANLAAKFIRSEVPLYVTSPIRISGSSFIAQTRASVSKKVKTNPVFFSGYGHFSQVRGDIEKFPNYGINLIQVEFGPSSIFPTEDTVSSRVVEDFLEVLDRAQKSHVAVNLLISPHYFPNWALDKYPHLKLCQGGFLKFCIDAPESRHILERYLRHVIPQLKGHPALHSICLTNEPIYTESSKCVFTQKLWPEWLKRKHGTMDNLNRRYRSDYATFGAVPIPIGEPLPQPIYYDWTLFNSERFANWHRFMADIIHQIAPELPVHAKIMVWMPFNRRRVMYGVDAELFGELSQINGNDCIKWYEGAEGESEWANSWQLENMAYDLQRSVADKPIFNSENHLIKDRDFGFIPKTHIRNVLWQGAIHGQSATTIWVWERTFDKKSDFAGSIMHRPLCAAEVGYTNLDLLRLSQEVTAIQNVRPQIGLLYSTASIVYSESHLLTLAKTYEALNFSGVKVGFITERKSELKELQKYRVILLPKVTHTTAEMRQALEVYVKNGGRLVMIGEGCLSRNEYDEPQQRTVSDRIQHLNEDLSSKELWKEFESQMGSWNIERLVRVVNLEGAPVWGVEYLTAQLGQRRVVNIVNYTRLSQRIMLEESGISRIKLKDLLGEKYMDNVLELSPLEIAFVEIIQ